MFMGIKYLNPEESIEYKKLEALKRKVAKQAPKIHIISIPYSALR